MTNQFEPTEFLRTFLRILDKANSTGGADMVDPYTGSSSSIVKFDIGGEDIKIRFSTKNDWSKDQFSIFIAVGKVFAIYAAFDSFPSTWGGHQIQNDHYKKFRLFLGKDVTTDTIDHYFTIIALTANRT